MQGSVFGSPKTGLVCGLSKEERVSRTVKAFVAGLLLVAMVGAAGCTSSASIKTATVSKTSLKVTVAASGKILPILHVLCCWAGTR